MVYNLTAETRETSGSKLEQLREDKIIPAVLYGIGVDNQTIQVSGPDFEKVYSLAGENQVIELTVGKNKTVNVLVKEVQINPIKRNIIHADFQAIDVNIAVEVGIPLEFTGVAPAVKASGGSLIKKMGEIEVRCKPIDLIPSLEVSLESLITLEDSIVVGDVKVPAELEVLDDPTDLVASVIPPRIEVEETKPEEDGEEGEESAEGKEGEEGAEGKKEEPKSDEGTKEEK